jgi:hypothetical protein
VALEQSGVTSHVPQVQAPNPAFGPSTTSVAVQSGGQSGVAFTAYPTSVQPSGTW